MFGVFFDVFHGGKQRVFFEYGGKIAAGGEVQRHGDVRDGCPVQKHLLGILDFLMVDEPPGGYAQLFFEFLLVLGAGEVGQGGQLLQGELRGDIVQDIVQGPADVRGETELLLLRKGDDQMEKKLYKGSDELRLVSALRQKKGVFQKGNGFLGVRLYHMVGNGFQPGNEMFGGVSVQKEEIFGIADVQLDPVNLSDCDGGIVRPVDLVGKRDENVSSGKGIVGGFGGKRNIPFGGHGKFKGVFVKVPYQRGDGVPHGVPGQNPKTRDMELFVCKKNPIIGNGVVILPIYSRIHEKSSLYTVFFCIVVHLG